MKRNLSLLLIPLIGGLFVLFSGCYTQLKTMREETPDNGDYTYSQANGDTAYMANGDSMQGYNQDGDNENCDGYYHPQVGFDYYYPSYGFGYAYGNVWGPDYWGYDYYPWYCGSPFIGYPWYGYGYLPGAYYYGGHYHGGYGYGGRYGYGVTRTPSIGRLVRQSQIEAGRGVAGINTNTTSGNGLPRAARLAKPMSGPTPYRANTNTANGRSAGVRNGSNHVYMNRNATQRYYRAPNAYAHPQAKSSAGRSSDRSYRASAPQHFSAPHISGGGARMGGGGGSRSGGGGGSHSGGGGGGRGGRR